MKNRTLSFISLVTLLLLLGVIAGCQQSTNESADSADSSPELKAAFDAEFFTRPDGYEGLSDVYGFKFQSTPKQMDPGLMYKAVADEAVDVIDAFATDGRIAAYDLKVLNDDKNYFPPYFAAPVVRQETLDQYPELEGLLNELGGKLPDQTMQQLNYKVDEEGMKAEDVAREFLVSEGLIETDAAEGSGDRGTIAIGSKNFTEQDILGEILAVLIETRTDLKVRRQLHLGGTMICFNALKAGDLDLYAEYTGTGLVNILEMDVITDPQEAYDVTQESYKEKWNLVWLSPFGFNNTYTLTMRETQAEALGIGSISDLAAYINKNQ